MECIWEAGYESLAQTKARMRRRVFGEWQKLNRQINRHLVTSRLFMKGHDF